MAYNREYFRKRREDPLFRQKQQVTKRRWIKKNPEKYKASQRNTHLKLTYGITQADYDALLFIQGGKCACCPAIRSSSGRHLHVDHCHITGRVRGLLCDECNQTLGNVGESVSRLHALISYLERY